MAPFPHRCVKYGRSTVPSHLGHNRHFYECNINVCLVQLKRRFTCYASGVEVTAAVANPKTSHVTEAAPPAAVIQPQAAQRGIAGATFQRRTQLLHNQFKLFRPCWDSYCLKSTYRHPKWIDLYTWTIDSSAPYMPFVGYLMCWIQTAKRYIYINGALYLVECGHHTLRTIDFTPILPARHSKINIIFKYNIVLLFVTVPP